MKSFFTLLFLLSACIATAQNTEDYAVELTATVTAVPAKIVLQWKHVAFGSPTYHIYKKAKTATTWGTAIASLPSTDSIYADVSVIADSAYEYMLWAEGSSLNSYGYIFAGIKSPAIHNKGILLLVVDSTLADSCATAIKTMMNDISGDGWQIIRHDFPRTTVDTAVKAVINSDYTTHANVKAVLILGHVAVPYSADFNASVNPPDGHVPQHDGAWPADVYYTCLTGSWTDATANDVSGSYAANWNIPGDGKWDQDFMPSQSLMQISRIDFNNMPSFSSSEALLMNRYLSKAHIYKMDSLAVVHRGLISDNFPEPFSGEAFAANGWRNFPPLVGRDSVGAHPFISSLAAESYQWAYGCGPGSFTSSGGIGTSSDFVSNPVNGIFTMLFGSYFGDWNVQDNFLRAPLCSNPPALTDCWAARPNWFFHHMALGENIGYSGWLTQNNTSLYQPTGFGNTWVHVALMGDLTLRTDYIKPPTSIAITAPLHGGANLSWTASPDAGVIGYYVYRADSQYGYYQRISASMVTTTSFHDATGVDGHKFYQVRPVKLQSTPSGAYYNLGVGIIDTATVSYPTLQVAAVSPGINVSVFPNPAQSYIDVTVNCGSNTEVSMFVMNMAGQTFDPITKELVAGSNHYRLNVTELPSGIYALVVKCGTEMHTTEWVKM